MSTAEINELTVIDLGVADDIIAGARGRLIGLEADTPAGYEAVRIGLTELRTMRTGVERSRKELKRSALEWGRNVDAEAKRVTDMILAIEEPLKRKKAFIDDAKHRALMEKAEAIQRAAEEKAKAEAEELEKRERAERERIAQEQAEERQRLAAERKALDAERAEQKRIADEEREQIREEQRKIQAQRDAIEAEKRKQVEAQARRDAETERKSREKQETKDRKAREEAEAKQAKLDLIEAERIFEERKPDQQKLQEFAAMIREIKGPEVKTEWAIGIVATAEKELSDTADAVGSELTATYF